MRPNVLVVRLSSLGDIVLTAPVYRALKAGWPDARVSVLVKPQYAAALAGNPHIDEVIPFLGLGDALRRVRAGGFTHLLDLHANLRSRILRAFARAPHVAVYRKNALARRLFVAFGWRSPGLERHNVERYLEALAPWGLAPAGSQVGLGEVGALSRPPAAGSRVLLVQSAFLGDTLLTLPLARDLKDALPSCRVSVLTLAKNAELFSRSPWVDEILVDDKRGAHGGLLGPARLARALAGRFDVAVIPHRSFRSAWLAWLAGIPRRVGFSSSAGRLLLTDSVPFTWMMHDLERNLVLLKALGVARRNDAARDAVYLSPDGPERDAVERRLREAGIAPGERLVGVHPGAVWATKRWLPERFAELCRRLGAEGFRPVLVGGPQDRALCADIARGSRALDWSGQTTLGELRALMGRLELFVTNDSGPMHLAAACGVPVLALFGATTRELGFFPYGPRHRVVEAELACRPCGLHGTRTCPEGHFLCMRLIGAEQVWEQARAMLRAPVAA